MIEERHEGLRKDVERGYRIALLTLNFTELFLEIVLYVSLIRVMAFIKNFLKSFSSVQTSPKENHIISNLNRLFSTLTAMTILMMITNSVFSLLSPYFWIGDVFASNKKISLAFLISTMLFYITNCAFALLLLYLHYKLQTNVQNEEISQNPS